MGDTYEVNDIKVNPQDFWTKLQSRGNGNVGITEENLFDATNIRLRNVSLSYTLPHKWFENTVVQGARIGLSANNVWMITSV